MIIMKTMFLNCSKKLAKKPLLTMVLLLFMSSGMAQISVTGQVTDAATNDPLIGANIIIKNTSKGAQTDLMEIFPLRRQKVKFL